MRVSCLSERQEHREHICYVEFYRMGLTVFFDGVYFRM